MAVTSWIRRSFKDGVITTATATMTAVATSFSVGTGQGVSFPDGSIGPFIVTVDQGQAAEEKILVQSRTSDSFTVATNGRGYNGTTAQAHTNATVLHTIDAQDLDEANQAAVQTLGAVQASGDLLQGTSANTLQRLARGSANQFLQAGASLLQWVGFGVGQSTTSAVGDTAADGTATTPARSDHKHGREAYATNTLTLGTAAAAGVATTLMRPDDTIAAFDTSAPTNSAVGDVAAAGSANFAARRDHKHGRESASTLGTLGYAQITANGAAQAGTADVAGLSVTVTVGTGRRIRVTGFAGSFSQVGAGQSQLQLWESTTQLSSAVGSQSAADALGATVVAILTPTAGSHTYKIRTFTTATTVAVVAANPDPAFILVEDIGT